MISGATGVPTIASQNGEPIKLLIIDDNAHDAELALMELRRANVAIESMVVGDEATLRASLERFAADVVLCDVTFPNFDGFTAQRIVRAAAPHTPLIFVSGTLSEGQAVLALQSGAVDYVLKSNLVRLPTAVLRAVSDAREKIRLKHVVDAATVALEASRDELRAREMRSRKHGERLEALWRIANLQGADLVVAMMHEAETALVPQQPFHAVLGKIEDGYTSVIAMGTPPVPDDPRTGIFASGTRIALDQTIIPLVGRTQAWDDLAEAIDVPTVPLLLGWRAVVSTQFSVGASRYSLTFASHRPAAIPFVAEDLSYVDVLASAIAKTLEVDALEDSLRSEEERTRNHADRLERLWQIVNSPDLHDTELWHAMLAQGAAGIHPGQTYWGLLWRVDGTDMVVEAVTQEPDAPPSGPLRTFGNRVPLDRTVVGSFLRGRTQTASWDDVRDVPDLSAYGREYGSRSLIVTRFSAGGATWGLSFTSKQPSVTPIGPLDRAYVEILASFFQNRVQQRWQFDRITYEQSHDVLTGLLNRSQFRSQARTLALNTSSFAVLMVDINQFREINQTYGHMIGDALLVEVGNALRERAAPTELVGRIGGNLFAVFLPEPITPPTALARAAAFATIFENGFSTGDRDGREFIARTACIGVAVAPDDADAIEAILSRAEAALTRAKAVGPGSIISYAAGMEDDVQRRTTLRNELIDAVARDEFTLYYQPHVEMSTNEVSGCEALIRWNHPTRGLLAPAQFIPFAEETGIIAIIDDWVMRNAFEVANELAALRPGFRLYFNLSGRQAGDPKLVRAFVGAARRGVALESIGVEITETDAMRDVEATRRVCRALRRLGVKIDRSFISGVLYDPHDGAITEAIIGIADRFGFASLAEGAEEPEEVLWLQHRACRYVQGYAICRPIALDAFKMWLAAHG